VPTRFGAAGTLRCSVVHDRGTERIAEGREAEIFAWEPGAVLKLHRSAFSGPEAGWEAAATDAVAPVGGPGPGSHGLVTVERCSDLVLDRIDGPDLVAATGRLARLVASLLPTDAASR
jgi:hypothetical protein